MIATYRNQELPPPEAIFRPTNHLSPSRGDKPCPSCGSNETILFHKINDVPVNSVINIRSREAALAFPRGEIALRFCHRCGFIYNASFDSRLVNYSSDCEESQGYSETFNAFARRLADRLVKKYNLNAKEILEIGCGKGEFLKLICELGDNRGVGFDPAYVAGRVEGKDADRLTFIKDYYSEKYSDYGADAIFCRMTLEHIPETAGLIQTVRKSIGSREDPLVFFQVPDVMRIVRDCAFEDIYYEHCSYFSAGSLSRLFVDNGFNVLDVRKDYNDQYIILESRASKGEPFKDPKLRDELNELQKYVDRFSSRFDKKVEQWSKILSEFQTHGEKVVLWGSGSKGVTFLTTLINSNFIEYVVDINPNRQGTYMAGTGKPVVGPAFLKDYLPDAVIIMNAIYREEIKQNLDQMGLDSEILTL